MTMETVTRALRGYDRTAGLAGTESPVSQTSANGPSFADLLAQQVGQTHESLEKGETATLAAIHGSTDTQAVVEAVAQAELSLQKLTAIREKVVTAYQEILRMPI